MTDSTKFFLGANSDKGFVSYFKQLQEQSDSMQLLILKGGPGSGKSSLMKRVLSYAKDKGHNAQMIACASDPGSLDAVIDYTGRFSIMDGTSPHVEDPILPGAQQHIMYTGDMWDINKLQKNRENIAFFSGAVSEQHKSATAYIKAASMLLKENFYYSKKHIDEEKIALYVGKIMEKIPGGNKKERSVRLLSALSVGEIVFFEKTLDSLCDTKYIIEDEWGGASDEILKAVENAAKLKGCRYIICPCSVNPEKTDHIIFPDAKIALSLKNSFLNKTATDKENGDAFYRKMDETALMQKRLRDASRLLSSACANIKKAKKLHDSLENFYAEAMDFSKMDGLFEKILNMYYKENK